MIIFLEKILLNCHYQGMMIIITFLSANFFKKGKVIQKTIKNILFF